jgi:hypothetical protein
MEYRYDPRHTGALRVIHRGRSLIYGSDPTEKSWTASLCVIDRASIELLFLKHITDAI